MRKVEKKYNAPPKILTAKGCERKILRAVNAKSGNETIYNGHHYRHADVTTELKTIYNNKCAYCESISSHVAPLQVEHYRPKAKVEEDSAHNGYYWLGCEWSNLLLSCSECNGKGAKGNHFPISGSREYHGNPFSFGSFSRAGLYADASPLINELPLLLNPEIDYPEKHLSFNHLGWIEGLTEKGEVSWKTYKLNRPDLYSRRQKVVNELIELLSVIVSDAKAGGKYNDPIMYKNILKYAFNKINYQQEKEEYTLWKWYIFNNFECVLSRIEAPYRRNIGKAFIMYRQGKL